MVRGSALRPGQPDSRRAGTAGNKLSPPFSDGKTAVSRTRTGGVTFEYEEQLCAHRESTAVLIQSTVQASLNYSQTREEGNFIILGRPRGLSTCFLAYVLGDRLNECTKPIGN